MSYYLIQRSTFHGEVVVPSSKSHSMRALLFASLAQGESTLFHLLESPDTQAMINACVQLGAKIKREKDFLKIQGVAGEPCVPQAVIDAENSGQVLRFIGAVAALADGYTVLTGDESIRKRRSIGPLCEGISSLGGTCFSAQNNGYAPFVVKGPLKGGTATVDGKDSQPVSALLIALSFIEGKSELRVINPGEKPWIEMTLDWLSRRHVSYVNENFSRYVIEGKKVSGAFSYPVPGDFSSAAFPLAAAIVTDSELTIKNLDMNDVQGDKLLIYLLQEMGANLHIDHEGKQVHVRKGSQLQGISIDVNPCIDAIAVLAILGCFSKGKTVLKNASIARQKESDRLKAITNELRKMGAKIEEEEDTLTIFQSQLSGADVLSHNDHRIAMALSVAGFGSTGVTKILDVDCVNKSYPDFAREMEKIGAKITVQKMEKE